MKKERQVALAEEQGTNRKAVGKKEPDSSAAGGAVEQDERKCLLCGSLGDRESELAGRLLYYRCWWLNILNIIGQDKVSPRILRINFEDFLDFTCDNLCWKIFQNTYSLYEGKCQLLLCFRI
jgi:hypothetical protein